MKSIAILRWEEAYTAGPSVVGGKGWNLSRLWQAGFPVPAGGVLAVAAYHLVLAKLELGDLARACQLDTAPSSTLRKLHETFRTSTLPERLTADLQQFLETAKLTDRPLAVRSSAIGEDGQRFSFAGMHASLLHVVGLESLGKAIMGCYASLWTERAVEYRRRVGTYSAEMAVVIQEMVPAVAAGVAFTCDPLTGRRDRVVTSSNWGLGESVVDGTVPTDLFTIATGPNPVLLKETIATKTSMTTPVPNGGVTVTAGPATLQQEPSLNRDQVLRLTRLALRVQSALSHDGMPQDIEWAWDGTRVVLLQARPVTIPALRLAAGEGPTIWSSANLREVVPGVLSPLSWDHLRFLLEELIPLPFTAAGCALPEGIPWVRLHLGRAYFNLTAMVSAYWNVFGLKDETIRQMVGGHHPTVSIPRRENGRSRITPFFRRLWNGLRLVAAVHLAELRAGPLSRRIWSWVEQERTRDLSSLTNGQLLKAALELERPAHQIGPVFQMVNMAAGGLLKQLEDLLERRLPGRGQAYAHALLTGRTQITSAEHGFRLAQLGNMALQAPDVRSFLLREPFQPAAWVELPPQSPFRIEFERFLKEFGHRGVQECDISVPRWAEDPSFLLQTIRQHVLSGVSLSAKPDTKRRAAAETEVFAALKGPVAWFVRLLVMRAQQTSARREESKSVFIKLSVITRKYALEIGRRMVVAGTIDQTDDVFFLSWFDVTAWLLEEWDGFGARSLVTSRRRALEHWRTCSPPDWVMANGEADYAEPEASLAAQTLVGIGASSGTVTGIARVVHSLDEASNLEPGEILVAPGTDPAWTPLFLRAAGLITESGGLISHAVIVAREYGLPAVVNVSKATQIIRTGDRLRLHGGAGRLEIL